MTSELDPLTADVLAAFHRLGHAHRSAFARAHAARGLQPAQAACLRTLAHNDGASQRGLADDLLLSPSALTRLLQRMERSGLVVRRPDAEDARLTRVHLTDAGRDVIAQQKTVVSQYVATTLGQLPPDDLRTLARLLNSWADLSADPAGEPKENHQ
jgi:MarR family transcriptional regulator, organic hydroperoxide resistance regulator